MRLPPDQSEAEGPNLTPVIDIVFLLLIFFLVATQFHNEEREIATQLAEVAEARPLSMAPQEVVINVDAQGDYIITGKKYSEEQLAGFLHELSVKNPGMQKVQIRPDKRVPFEFPARVMGLCERERISHYVTTKLEFQR
jgi:biopolymer transport protein ExbD